MVVFLAKPASATQFNIFFDDQTVHLVTSLYERKSLNPQLIEDILQTPGNQLLFDQEFLSGQLPRYRMERDYRRGLEGTPEGTPRSRFRLEKVRAHPKRYRRALTELHGATARIQWLVSGRLNALLPALSHLNATAHFVIGGRASGFSFSHRTDVVLRFDDFVRDDPDEPLDLNRLASVLCHELYHVGFQEAGGRAPRPERGEDDGWYELARIFGPDLVGEVWRVSNLDDWDAKLMRAKLFAWEPPRGWSPTAMDKVLGVLSRIQNEGCAVHAEEPLRDITGDGVFVRESRAWLALRADDLARFDEVLRLFDSGVDRNELAALTESRFHESGPFYRIGAHIAHRIDTEAGRRPYLSTVRGGPLAFFEAYFRTHPEGGLRVSPEAKRVIDLIRREVTAMGRLDPLAP